MVLKEGKIIYILYNGLENNVSVCNKNIYSYLDAGAQM